MPDLIRRLHEDESGASGIDYALIVVLVSLTIIPALHVMGDALITQFTRMTNDINSWMAP